MNIGNIEKSRRYSLNENINHSRVIKTGFKFCCKMAFPSSANKDVQGYVQDILHGSFRCKDSVKCKVKAIFSFQVATRRGENECYFPLSRKVREN